MSSDLAVSIRGLGKSYRIRHDDPRQVGGRGAAVGRLKRSLVPRSQENFWALRDVDLEVRKGEILGIVGHNGAGKSTLLKILSRITQPTTGRVEIFGRIGSLLEVGTGFHPELTGRENIFLNATILGMRRREVARRFDEIVAFSGVERFLDTPVKRYSSGMYVRLAFAVAAHLDTEILLVDEVLAVGDAVFQRKALGKMGEAVGAGRTVLLVTHNLGFVTQLANRCALLDGGRIVALEEPFQIVERYIASQSGGMPDTDFTNARRPEPGLDQTVTFVGGNLKNSSGLVPAGEPLRFELRLKLDRSLESVRIVMTIHRVDAQPVGTGFVTFPAGDVGTCQTVLVELADMRLGPGHYYFTFGVADGHTPVGARNLDVVTDVLHFEYAHAASDGVAETWHAAWGGVRLSPTLYTE